MKIGVAQEEEERADRPARALQNYSVSGRPPCRHCGSGRASAVRPSPGDGPPRAAGAGAPGANGAGGGEFGREGAGAWRMAGRCMAPADA